MFPLSDQALLAVLYAGALLLITAVLYGVTRVSVRSAILVAILGTIGIGALLLPLGNGYGPLTHTYFQMLFVVTVTPLLALVWVLIIRRFVHGTVLLVALLALPAVAVAGVFVERQIVWESACSTEAIKVKIASHVYAIPPEFRADLRVDGQGNAFLRYSKDRNAKEDVHRLCELVGSGGTPLDASMLWMAPGLYNAQLHNTCTIANPPGYCDGYEAGLIRLTGALQVMERDETVMRYELSQAGKTLADGIRFEGDAREGFMCRGDPGSEWVKHCRMWRSLDEESVVLITSNTTGDVEPHEKVLDRLERVMDFFLKAMRR